MKLRSACRDATLATASVVAMVGVATTDDAQGAGEAQRLETSIGPFAQAATHVGDGGRHADWIYGHT
jgi:hypothetical protein